ncbi:nuclear transport factor 2 family protein [Paenibacillus timonensis]|uniref:Nuclear transport factor 2 family protein n=1 Tax=Paenibacillus timonensis TaxID=225915 RepID=A0ABW3S625_9BACL|nr:nuclear transport factor 2 family protein [Paenibacillus timonensis]MCH1638548.1 nuclear transport factor 2 family protein [Paenibacillus timonensis]
MAQNDIEAGLPQTIRDFFRASNAHRTEDLLACFADNGEVLDDGGRYEGRDMIRAWSGQNYIGAQVHAEPIGMEPREGEWAVQVDITGDYPGGPYRFWFCFTLDQGRISKLEIMEVSA